MQIKIPNYLHIICDAGHILPERETKMFCDFAHAKRAFDRIIRLPYVKHAQLGPENPTDVEPAAIYYREELRAVA